MNFDEEAIAKWVKDLTETDKRVAGLKDFEWNETVTPEQKFVTRVRKLAEKETQKKNLKFQKERDAKKAEYEARKKERDAEREARRIEREE